MVLSELYSELFSFLCKNLKGYLKERNPIKAKSGWPTSVVEFLAVIGHHSSFLDILDESVFFESLDSCNSLLTLQLESIDYSVLPKEILPLYTDGFSIWFVEIGNEHDPAVQAINCDMDTPVIVNSNFSWYITSQLVNMVFKDYPSILVSVKQPLQSKTFLGISTPNIWEVDGVVIALLDEQCDQEIRANLYFDSVKTLIMFVNAHRSNFTLEAASVFFGSGKNGLVEIACVGFYEQGSELKSSMRIEDDGIEINLVSNSVGFALFYREVFDPETTSDLLVVCDKTEEKKWCSWILSNGGVIRSVRK